MTTAHQVLEGGAGFLLWTLIAVSITLTKLFERQLRRAHREVWEDLGSPSLILNNTPRNLVKLLRFLWSGSYRRLRDQTLDVLGAGLKLVQLLACVAVAIGMVFAVIARAG